MGYPNTGQTKLRMTQPVPVPGQSRRPAINPARLLRGLEICGLSGVTPVRPSSETVLLGSPQMWAKPTDVLPSRESGCNQSTMGGDNAEIGTHDTGTSMGDLITFNIYGGPDAGKITQVAPGVTTHSVDGFEYVLAKTGADRWSFLPSSDTDLVDAYERTKGKPGNAEADALAAEIERRNLDI